MRREYHGALTDENISRIFEGAADFVRRKLICGKHTIYAYAIDGLIAAGSASDYVLKPIVQQLSDGTMEALYENAMNGDIYNCVAVPCDRIPVTSADICALRICVSMNPKWVGGR